MGGFASVEDRKRKRESWSTDDVRAAAMSIFSDGMLFPLTIGM
jgi:hypothetical protein